MEEFGIAYNYRESLEQMIQTYFELQKQECRLCSGFHGNNTMCQSPE